MVPWRSGWRSGRPTANGSRPTAHLMPWKRNPRALPPLQQNRSPGANSAASSSRSSRSCARILCPISRFPPNRAGARPHTAHQAPLSRWRCPKGRTQVCLPNIRPRCRRVPAVPRRAHKALQSVKRSSRFNTRSYTAHQERAAELRHRLFMAFAKPSINVSMAVMVATPAPPLQQMAQLQAAAAGLRNRVLRQARALVGNAS